MPTQIVNIELPDAIYQRFQRVADATNRPLEEVVFQTISGNLPPSLDDLGTQLQGDVADLQHLRDDALWTVAREKLSPQLWRRHQSLLRKAHERDLTATEQTQLAELRTATDRYVTRRSYALALLKWHGHTIPTDL